MWLYRLYTIYVVVCCLLVSKVALSTRLKIQKILTAVQAPSALLFPTHLFSHLLLPEKLTKVTILYPSKDTLKLYFMYCKWLVLCIYRNISLELLKCFCFSFLFLKISELQKIYACVEIQE